MRHRLQSSDLRWWHDEENWRIILLSLPEPLRHAVTGNFSRMTIASSLEDYRFKIIPSPVTLPQSLSHSWLKKIQFDWKIILLISQILPLFWLLDPFSCLGLLHPILPLPCFRSIKSFFWFLFYWTCFIPVFVFPVPGSGCDGRLVPARANFVHI